MRRQARCDVEGEARRDSLSLLQHGEYRSQTMQRLLREVQQQQQEQEQNYTHCPSISTKCSCSSHCKAQQMTVSRCWAEDDDVPLNSSKLEDLVEAAFQGCEHARKLAPADRRHLAVGAALLCHRNGDIFVGHNLLASKQEKEEEEEDAGEIISAGRAVLLKAVSEGHSQFEALVLAAAGSSNKKDRVASVSSFPLPNAVDRRYLREYGDFPVFLVNTLLEVQATSTQELFPLLLSPSPCSPKQGPGLTISPPRPKKQTASSTPYSCPSSRSTPR